MPENNNLFIGLMSGTSMDAVDAALVEITHDALDVIDYHQYPLPRSVQETLKNINGAASLHEISALDLTLAELFADAVQQLLSRSGRRADEIRAIGSHGQTILHLPEEEKPRTVQIADANIIAYQTGITTVADFRRMDLAAGGQGAPLACAFHAWYFRDPKVNRVILNIGGMANVTLLPADPDRAVTGFDTGPGNALLDEWTQRHLREDYDKDGAWALSGKVNKDLLGLLLPCQYFNSPPPKSTGKDDFNLVWLEKNMAALAQAIAPVNVQASLLELTALTISAAIERFAKDAEEVLVCGGGIHNTALMRRLDDLLPGAALNSTAKYGLDPDAVEAVSFAWLARQRLDKNPANLPAVTGARQAVVLGAVYQAS